jgi:hypothetical protein
MLAGANQLGDGRTGVALLRQFIEVGDADVVAGQRVLLVGRRALEAALLQFGELEIAVQAVQEKGMTIHQLAARKILQELEQGSGYIHSGVSKTANPGTFDEWVKREGVRVGVRYGLASKWTSFLAVTNGETLSEEAKYIGPDTRNTGSVRYRSIGVGQYASHGGGMTKKCKVGRGGGS